MAAALAEEFARTPADLASTGAGCAHPVVADAASSDAITMGVVFCRMARTIAESK